MSDEENITVLYEKYANAIYRFCLIRVRERFVAEELVQETFIRLWRYLKKGKEVRNIRSFLYSISSNLIIDYSRKRKSLIKKEASLEDMMERENYEPSYPGGDKIEEGVLFKEVMQTLQELPSESQEILILYYVEELLPKEIAEIKNQKPHNVTMKINRATKALRLKQK